MSLLEQYRTVRQASEAICRPLKTEDYVVQPVADVSPPKWHLGHTTWFWETFVLMKYDLAYKVFNPDYNYVFNSYYETIGARVIRTDRGSQTGRTSQYFFLSAFQSFLVSFRFSLELGPS